MKQLLRNLRPLLAVGAFVLTLAPLQMSADVITYQFTGDCAVGDCSGTGTGMLTLTNYSVGSEIMASNFVGFTYHSNLIDINITPATLQYVDGFLFGPLPSPEYVFVRGTDVGALFNSLSNQQSGSWCGGSGCRQDNGPTSMWNVATDVAPVPEPAMFLPVAGVLLAVVLRKRRRA